MYTLHNSHIIFHLHNFNDIFYIRAIVCENSSVYLREINKVYSFNETLNDINIFYNCGDLYERLLNDLSYKKFKNMELIKKCTGIWQIETKDCDIINWYSSVYIPCINSKISMYLEDIDDDYYKINNIDWSSYNFNNYIKHDFISVGDYVKNGTIYTLLNCEQMTDKLYIVTHNHLLAVLKQYIINKYIDIVSYVYPEKWFPDNDDSTLVISETIRGICINKNELLESDIIKIFKYMNVAIGDLVSIARDKKFMTLFDDERKFYNDASEFNIFNSKYMYLDNAFIPICNGDIDGAYKCSEQWETKNAEAQKTVDLACKKTGLLPSDIEIYKTNIYKNILTNAFVSYDEILTSLVELQLLSEFTYKSEYMKQMLNNIHTMPQSTLLELKELINIINNVIENSRDSSIVTQKTLTETYINKYKNDTAETLASKVIDNVISYLLEEKLESINKNDIGKDLVDLGVKKIRKSKGYVYGLDDSKHSEKVISADETPQYTIDKNKVQKQSNQIRSEPTVLINTDLLKFSIPSKYVIPNEIK